MLGGGRSESWTKEETRRKEKRNGEKLRWVSEACRAKTGTGSDDSF